MSQKIVEAVTVSCNDRDNKNYDSLQLVSNNVDIYCERFFKDGKNKLIPFLNLNKYNSVIISHGTSIQWNRGLWLQSLSSGTLTLMSQHLALISMLLMINSLVCVCPHMFEHSFFKKTVRCWSKQSNCLIMMLWHKDLCPDCVQSTLDGIPILLGLHWFRTKSMTKIYKIKLEEMKDWENYPFHEYSHMKKVGCFSFFSVKEGAMPW